MSTLSRLVAAVLCGLMLLSLVGCAPDAPETLPTEVTAPTLSNEEIYDLAREKLLSSPNQIINYTLSQTRTVNEQDYTENVTATVSLSGLGAESMEALVQETLAYGTMRSDHTLIYCAGAAYSQISGQTFTKTMSAEEFAAAQLPGALLDRVLYGAMEMEVTADGTVFSFSDPSQLESWVTNEEDAQLTGASGTATLDTNGLLIGSTYTAAYTLGSVTYRLEVSLRVSAPNELDLSAIHPEHLENAVTLDCLEAPKLLMRAVGDIFTARDMDCSITETIYSQAIPLLRNRQSTASIREVDQSTVASLTSSFQTTDYRGQPTDSSQDYQFADGVCTSTVNGGAPTVQEGVTAETMRTSIEDTVLSALFATRYLAGASLSDEGECYVLRFSGNDAYCTDLSADIGAFLKMDLDGLASSHQTTEATGYLSIHKQTGLPTAMGMSFARTHTIADVANQLIYKLDQTLQLSPA